MADQDIDLLLEAQSRRIDDFEVGRVLPAPLRRMVGPFVFFDHIGPASLAPGRGLDVRPHPHIHLATVTYLFEGEIFHRDSLGSAESIRPGAINWMKAGRGIVHSERSPAEERSRGPRMHGLQLWVALPRELEESEPSFAHHGAATLPELDDVGVRLRILAGEAFGARSPVAVSSPLMYVEARLESGAKLSIPEDHEERAAYVISGEVSCGATPIPPHTMVVLKPKARPVLEARTPACVMLIGGARLDGPRYIWWNFVSSSKERIDEAARAWRERRFPLVPGDEVERIPLPE